MPNTFQTFPSGRTQQKSIPKSCQISTVSVEDSPAKLSVLQDEEEVFRIHVDHSFLKLHGLQKRNDHAIFFLKTSKAYSITTKEILLEQSSPRLMKWGTMRSGRCLTANFSFRKTEREFSLSDIYEENPDKKYFLSEQAIKSMIAHAERHKKKGNGFGTHILWQ